MGEDVVFITGKETVEDLFAMVDKQDDPSSVISLIFMTTRLTRPATFNQFTKKLSKERPELYNKSSDLLNSVGIEKTERKLKPKNIIIVLIIIILLIIFINL
tara:strand:+ start:152 stop:457 length:306 start_codon:yes stop_codon:yes gene_type:complete